MQLQTPPTNRKLENIVSYYGSELFYLSSSVKTAAPVNSREREREGRREEKNGNRKGKQHCVTELK